MSMDSLKNKIRKLKNPSAVTIAPSVDVVPPSFLTEGTDMVTAMGNYCVAVLEALKGLVPAAKISFGAFALYGAEGMKQLETVVNTAEKLGYYVILDWQRLEDEAGANAAARVLLGSWKCDGIVVCGYAGSACIKPYITEAAKKKQDVFVTIKTGGKSGAELQDLQTGGRVVYTAAADLVNRWGAKSNDRCGYSRVGAMVAANHPNSLKTLRQKYPQMFLLVDGLEHTNANARNASFAFDNMGCGALVCCNLLDAWQEAPETDPVEAALNEAQRMKRNIMSYVMIF